MVQTRVGYKAVDKIPNGHLNHEANGHANGHVVTGDNERTDYTRWRLLDEQGRHTWHYLASDDELKAWPQSIADKHHLGFDTVSSLNMQSVWTNGLGSA